MSMRISIRAADPAPASRVFPWPVLEAGNGSFANGIYSVSLSHEKHGRSFCLTHKVEGAELIVNWIAAGKVRFICSVATPISAYRELNVSFESTHIVEWKPEDLGSHPLFTPMIVSGVSIEHLVDAERDGLDPLWDGKKLFLPKGAKIAVCPTFALQSGLLGLLDFVLKKDFDSGRFKVEPSQEEGFKFKVHLAEDLYDYLYHSRQEHAGSNIMTHIISAALVCLNRHYSEDDGNDGWKSFRNLVALADLLEEKQLSHWGDEGFEPEFVATGLYPHVTPMVLQGENG